MGLNHVSVKIPFQSNDAVITVSTLRATSIQKREGTQENFILPWSTWKADTHNSSVLSPLPFPLLTAFMGILCFLFLDVLSSC